MKQQSKRQEEKKKVAGQRVVNNVDLAAVMESKRIFEEQENGHHYVEKELVGEFRTEGGSPAFVSELRSDVSSHIVTCDEPHILGGSGVHPSPLSYVVFGVLACFANTLAIQCSLEGVSLASMKLRGKLSYDIGPILTEVRAPMIKKLEIEVDTDKDIRGIIEVAKRRCPALYLVDHGITAEVGQRAGRRATKPSSA